MSDVIGSDVSSTPEAAPAPASAPLPSTLPPALHRMVHEANALLAGSAAGESDTVPAQDAPQAEPEPERAAEAQPEPEIDWKHRFESLRGKHNAEIARLNGEIASLQKVIAAMQAAPPASAPAPASAPPQGFDLPEPSPEEVAEFGEDFFTAAEKAAARRLGPYIRALEEKIARLERGVHGIAAAHQADARQHLYEVLSREVPNWAEQDRDPAFLSWLQGVDPISGEVRQRLLDRAVETNNVQSVVALFQAFNTMQASAAPQSKASPSPRSSRTSLDAFTAPGRSRAGTAPSAPAGGEPPVFRQSDIARFYDAVRRGVYRDNPAEKARIEQAIFAATAAGRVLAG